MSQFTIQQAFDLAVKHHQAGRLRDTEGLYRQILVLAPHYSEVYCNLGSLLKDNGRLDEAIAVLGQAIALKADFPEANNNLGIALKESNRVEEAIAAWRRAIALRPDYAEAHNNLGNALNEKGLVDEAIAAHRTALVLRPDYAEAHNNLGNALQDKGEFDEAELAYRHAIGLNQSYAEPHINLGNVLYKKGRIGEAIAAYRQAIALRPGDAKAHLILGRLLLSSGQFAEGWEEFEWRLRVRSARLDRDFPQPYWNGEDLPGQTLLIYTEGGFGDALNFIRLVPQVSGRVGKVVVECQPELLQLFANIPGVDRWIARGEALPPFDCRIALPSLPRILGIRLQTIPNNVPYLKAPIAGIEYWRKRIPKDGVKNIGLCWSGSVGKLLEHPREISLFTPIAKIPGIRFFSLQKGPEGNQSPPEGMELIDHTKELNDFADTAALIENLDLVISVDTSIIHLAGALAKPVWVLIPKYPDFRWLLDREDSPWYPTLRLFRQQSRGDWESVVGRAAKELSGWR
jgi:tetratricopeptide (TPR) repeat protein